MPDIAVRTAFKGVDKLSPVFKKMGAGADKFGAKGSRAFGKVNRASSMLMGTIKSMLPIISGVAIFQFANRSIDMFQTQQAAVANVEAGLKSTNNAIGLTSKQLQDMASEIQQTGIFGDEAILQNATAQFLTFGNIGSSNFKRIQTAAVDVTTKLYGVEATAEQIRTTSIMMGKAMDDPVRGMGAMRRVGISFSKTEEDLIKKMTAANDTVGAQNLMLQAIERQYGGTNAALAKTDAGMERMMKNKLGDTMELIGEQIVPLKQTLFEFAAWILPKINSALPVFVGFLKTMSPVIIAVAAGFVAYKAALFAASVWQGIMMAASWVQYLWMMKDVIMAAVIRTKLWAAAQAILNFVMSMNPIALIVIAITALIAAIGYVIYNWDELKKSMEDTWWGQVILTVIDAISQALDILGDKLTGLSKLMEGDFSGAAKSITMSESLFKAAYAAEGQGMTQDEFYESKFNAPNEAQASQQNVNLQGEINIAGAPSGSTAKSTVKGAAPIKMNMVGENP